MNQIVRFSQFADAESIEEPSAALRVPFAQSGAFVCKFIIGEPNDRAVCCGAPVPDGKSWCAFHRKIVFEPSRPAAHALRQSVGVQSSSRSPPTG